MVSVVIPAYNRAYTLERSVNSVLSQSCADLEVIIVDDCSDDNTAEIIKGIPDPRIRYERLDQRSGACVARNTGIALANGEYIAFQDSDDEWLPDKLRIQLDLMKKENADICFSALNRHYLSGKTVIWPKEPKESGRIGHTVLRRRSAASTQTIVAKKEVFEEILFDPLLAKSQDYDWMIRASEKHTVCFAAEPLVEQYLQKDSISTADYGRFVSSRQYLLEKYRDLCEQDPVFHYYLLQQLAHYKTLSEGNAREEYAQLFRIKPDRHNACCLVLSKLGLIRHFVSDHEGQK